VLRREQRIGPLQHSSQLLEDERVKGVGTDVTLGAAPMLTASAYRIVVMAGVIARIVAAASAHSMTADRDAAVTALEHMAQ